MAIELGSWLPHLRGSMAVGGVTWVIGSYSEARAVFIYLYHARLFVCCCQPTTGRDL